LHSTISYFIQPPSLTFLFFFFQIPPPTTSTLFPYTTLFRSGFDRTFDDESDVAGDGIAKLVKRIIFPPFGFNHCPSFPSCGASRDRKSTRLNSSHDQISYAVFCLKKKKKKTNNTIIKKKKYN